MGALRQGWWREAEQERRDPVPHGGGARRPGPPKRGRRPAHRARPELLPLALALAFALGCGGDDGLNPPPPVADRELYWSLDLNHHAVLMSSAHPLYDTLTLVATPRNPFGEALGALGALGAPSFTSPNPDLLLVSPTGRLIAVAPTSEPLPVVVSLTVGNLRYADTAYVTIVAEPAPPRLATFSAHPVPPDSAKLGAASFNHLFGVDQMYAVLPIRATDSAGQAISGLQVHLRSSDPRVLTISTPINGQIRGVRPGAVSIYASTTVFGIAKTDTVPYRIGWPVARLLQVGPNSAGTLTVGVGAVVQWTSSRQNGDTILDVTFRDADPSHVAAFTATSYGAWDHYLSPRPDGAPWDPATLAPFFEFVCNPSRGVDCGSGNIVNLVHSSSRAFRVFPVAGTYEYTLPRHGVSGRIVVVDDAVPAGD